MSLHETSLGLHAKLVEGTGSGRLRAQRAAWHGRRSPGTSGRPGWFLLVAALGVVFGGIGTSPVHTVRTVLSRGASVGQMLRPELVHGMASPII